MANYPNALILLTCTSAALAWVVYKLLRQNVSRPPYPPGPPIKGLLSGNASDLLLKYPWLAYTEWGRKYGNLLHFRAFNQHIVIINSFKLATEMLEKRSQVYSSRPFVPMWDLMGITFATGVRDYSPEWKRHRRIFQKNLRQSTALGYRTTQTDKIKDMLYGFLTSPDDFRHHLKTAAGAIIMSVMYGYDVEPKGDPFVKLVEDSQAVFEKSFSMTWTVNFLPVLRYIPSWFPGAGFKRYAISVRKMFTDSLDIPFKYTLARMAEGSTQHSVVSSLVSDCQTEHDIQTLREVAGTGYGGAVNTTASTVLVFIVAMIENPDVQAKAQRELDAMTGGDRLVDYADQNSLPYIQAILREVLRWRPVTPLALPHASSNEDVHGNYYVPKGSIVIANVWAMTRDTTKYKSPESFDPERFLSENGELIDDDVSYHLDLAGVCPGSHLASANIWLMMATMLQMFNWGQKKDSAGNDTPSNVPSLQGLIQQGKLLWMHTTMSRQEMLCDSSK